MTRDHYCNLLDSIKTLAHRYGRSPNEITVVAVTKTHPWEDCQWLYQLGHRDFGENRIAEALEKKQYAPEGSHWHLIGTLQSNKVRKVVGEFTLIHSVDTPELVETLSRCSIEKGVITKILLQANTSGEPTKHGVSPEVWKQHYDKLILLNGISIEGLMTMAPKDSDEKTIRSCFASLRRLRDELKVVSADQAPMHHLSMGMSQDYPFAIAEGATILRIGTALWQ